MSVLMQPKRIGLPRTFVGFSGTDTAQYRLMLAWKANEHIEFNFADTQLDRSLESDDETYIKRRCRERIEMAGTFIQLIGNDTRFKRKYVRWEVEVAREKKCRLIGVNLNMRRDMDGERTPAWFQNVGALFVPFSPKAVARALEIGELRDEQDWILTADEYRRLGYPA